MQPAKSDFAAESANLSAAVLAATAAADESEGSAAVDVQVWCCPRKGLLTPDYTGACLMCSPPAWASVVLC